MYKDCIKVLRKGSFWVNKRIYIEESNEKMKWYLSEINHIITYIRLILWTLEFSTNEIDDITLYLFGPVIYLEYKWEINRGNISGIEWKIYDNQWDDAMKMLNDVYLLNQRVKYSTKEWNFDVEFAEKVSRVNKLFLRYMKEFHRIRELEAVEIVKKDWYKDITIVIWSGHYDSLKYLLSKNWFSVKWIILSFDQNSTDDSIPFHHLL